MRDPPDPYLHCRADLACLLSQVEHLGCDRQAAVEILRPPGRPVSPLQCVGERGPVAEAARHRHRLLAQLGSAVAVVREGQGFGQAARHPGAQLAVLLAEAAERLFEQVDERLVHGSGLERGKRPAETERRAPVARRAEGWASPAARLNAFLASSKSPARHSACPSDSNSSQLRGALPGSLASNV